MTRDLERAKFWEDRCLRLEAMLENAPEVPSPKDLTLLSEHGGKFDDWAVGKRLQQEHGLGVIPPTTECEIGAGAWYRITGGKADFSVKRKAMTVAEIINRVF